MATPPEPPKTPSKAAKPATPRRSSRKAATAKPATPRAANASVTESEPKAPAAAKPVPKRRTTRKAVPPVAAPKTKSGPKPKAKPAVAKAATRSVATTATTARKSVAKALPSVQPKTAWSLGAVALAAGAGIAAFLSRGRIMALLSGKADEGHVPTDLLDPTRNADDRAIADFRPNMDAVMTAAEREALRPPPGLPN